MAQTPRTPAAAVPSPRAVKGATPSPRGGPLSQAGWHARANLTFADWARQGRWLGALGRACKWWIGDWIRYGNARYGERYEAAARITGYDVQSLMNMAYVASRFETSRRREKLSWSHHAEVAALELEDQDRWLDRADSAGLSVHRLREERRAAERSLCAGTDQLDAPDRAARFHRGPVDREIEAPGLGTGDGELVCPECGHRFAPGPRGVTA